MVAAAVAGNARVLFVRKRGDGLEPHERRRRHGSALVRLGAHVFRSQHGHTDGSHEAGMRRAGDGAPDELLKGAQHGIVSERTALHHNALPQLVEVRHADDLGEHVLDDGAAKTGHDVTRSLAAALLAHHGAVHKDGAATAQARGLRRGECARRDILDLDSEVLCKSLQKRAATGRACLVHHDVGEDTAVEPDGLHVLAADVEHERDVGLAGRGRAGMGDRLDRVVVGMEGAGKELLAVARGAHSIDRKRDACLLPALFELHKTALGRIERGALVVGIETIDKFARVVDDRELGGRATRVDAERRTHAGTARIRARPRRRLLRFMSVRKVRALGIVCEKRLCQALVLVLVRVIRQLAERGGPAREVDRAGLIGKRAAERERGTAGHHNLRLIRHEHILERKVQLLGEHADERGVVSEGASLKNHRRLDIDALRKAADGLARHRMQGRKRKVCG